MNAISEKISSIGVVPVIKLNNPERDAVNLAKALVAGGVPVAEVTFRAAGAATAIKLMSDNVPEMLVGAGTVMTTAQVDEAIAAGAKFIVTPGLDIEIVKYCQEKGVEIYAGCTTPTDYHAAYKLGLQVLKFFPAEQSGGLAKIKAMSAPYGNIKFMPTGGVSLDNVNDYLASNKILACGGSFMVKESYIDNDNWDEITKLTRQSVSLMLGLKLGHIGINNENEAEAKATANALALLMGQSIEKESAKGMFVGTEFEVLKANGRGKNGHIAILTNSVDRAVYHLTRRGVKFDMDSATFDKDGSMKFIYLAEEINGFAYHLVK